MMNSERVPVINGHRCHTQKMSRCAARLYFCQGEYRPWKAPKARLEESLHCHSDCNGTLLLKPWCQFYRTGTMNATLLLATIVLDH